MSQDMRLVDLMSDLLIEQKKSNELLTVLNQSIITVNERLLKLDKDASRHTLEIADVRNSLIELASKVVINKNALGDHK
jgi:hypothetical protein